MIEEGEFVDEVSLARQSLGRMLLPAGTDHAITFTAWGDAKPAGSKVSGVAMRKNPTTGKKEPVMRGGRYVTFTKDDVGAAGKTWRGDVRDAVLVELGEIHELLDGPLVIVLHTYVARSASHYGTGRNAGVLKPSAPRFPHRRQTGDGTKLLRAVEDALNKFLVFDDKRFVRGVWMVDFGRPRAEVSIFTLPEAVGLVSAEGEQPRLALAD